MKYSIFHIQGGLGKHVAATAVAQAIKKARHLALMPYVGDMLK